MVVAERPHLASVPSWLSHTSARSGRIYGFIVEDSGEPSLPIPSVHTPHEELDGFHYHQSGASRTQRSRATTISSLAGPPTWPDSGDNDTDEDRPLLQAQSAPEDGSDGDEDEATRMDWIQSQPWHRRPATWYIMLNMVCFSLGIGLVSAPKMELFTQVICQHITFGHDPGAEECRQSTAVQKQLAQLNTILSLVTGTLCISTTAFWGGISDRYGRRGALILNMLSFVLGDVIFIAVLRYPSRFPLLLVVFSPFFEGLFGGHPGNQSISAAYLGDCTPAGSRAGIFSILTAILFGGIAAGPAIGSLLITYTRTIFAPFYAALGLHVAQGLFFLIFLPESMSPQRKLQAQHAHEQKMKRKAARNRQRLWGVDFLRGLVSPMGLLAPRRVPIPNSNKTGLDWSLPLVASASAIYAMGIALYPVKLQYAQLEFGWSAVQLGNLLSFIGLGRIIALLVAIPLISSILRRITAASVPKYPAMSAAALDRKGSTAARDRLDNETRLVQDHKFDLALSRLSILIEVAAFASLVFTKSPAHFIVSLVIQSLGSGASPALSSMRLMFASPEEMGRLMGAMNVLTTIVSQLVAPVLFNYVFLSTIDTWPEAIFMVAAGLFGAAFVAMLFVRVRWPHWSSEEEDSLEVVQETSLLAI